MAPPNPYLTGNFAPVHDEVLALDLPIEGTLPPELAGRFMRNGPNPINPVPESHHWFLGDGMLHAIEIRGGRAVSYRNRWVRTDTACEQLGEKPPGGQPADVFAGGSSVANTHVVQHAGRILALVEVCLPTEVTPELATVGRYNFDGQLRSAMTAHPKTDPETGELLFFGYDVLGPPWLRFHVADAEGTLVRSQDIDIAGPSMVHDFAITRDHVVFFDLPVVYDMELAGTRPLPARWMPEYGARVGVLPRDGGEVRWFEVEPCYVFHTLGAYDDGDTIVLDVVRHPRMFADDLYGPAEDPPTLDRWTIDLLAGKVREQRLDDRSQEFPRIDDRLTGRPYRYGYTAEAPVRAGHFNFGGLVKHDLHSGKVELTSLRAGDAAGEPVFVPASGGNDEDDGWLLSVVYDRARDGSDLIVLSARDFTAPPIARVRLPQRVPFGFHGSWLPDGP